MAIYDYDGTATLEIGKLYDDDGTLTHQISKVYDSNGSANSLIYQDSVYVVQNGVINTEEFGSFVAVQYNSNPGMVNRSQDDYWLLQVNKNSSQNIGYGYFYMNKPIDLSKYSSVVFDVGSYSSYAPVQINLSSSKDLSGTMYATTKLTPGYVNSEHPRETVKLDISAITQTGYILLFLMTCVGYPNLSSFLKIYNIYFE